MAVVANLENTTVSLSDQSPESLLWRACSQSEIIAQTMAEAGHESIREYLRRVFAYASISLQPRTDLAEAVYQIAEPLLGDGVAADAAASIKRYPIALTANHHGVDFFAQSVQSGLLFALGHNILSKDAKAALVFACGNIPLDNLTYPQGLMVYRVTKKALEAAPLRLPLFPNSLRRWMVSVAPGYTSNMVARTLQRVSKLAQEGFIRNDIAATLELILGQDFIDERLLSLPRYEEQAVCLNHRIWQRIKVDAGQIPDLVYLELERIASCLLLKDLVRDGGLAKDVLFHPRLRTSVLRQLDGNRACWAERNEAVPHSLSPVPICDLRGTHFFWGVSKNGRKFALKLHTGGGRNEFLIGIDNASHPVTYAFNEATVVELIRAGRLVPSLFTCFLVLAFARGVNCVGGYYQADYLPRMQKGLLRAMEETPGYSHTAKIIRQVPTRSYLSGMQTIMSVPEDLHWVPAGPIEILSANGINSCDTQTMLSMTVKDAHIASLFETMPDLMPWEVSDKTWKQLFSCELSKAISAKVVFK